jgi:hypothetical protein
MRLVWSTHSVFASATDHPRPTSGRGTGPAAPAAQFERKGQDQAGAAHPDRVVERDRARLTLTRSAGTPGSRPEASATPAKASLISFRSKAGGLQRAVAVRGGPAQVPGRMSQLHAADGGGSVPLTPFCFYC